MLCAVPSLAANNRPLIYGMNPTPMSWWYPSNPDPWDQQLFYKMAQAGCSSARIGINWDQVEPVKGTRDWTGIDKWVKWCLDNNIEPVILINSTPEWALPDDYDPSIPAYVARYPPGEDHAEDFHNWVFDLVRRYRGRARYYEFWNEANGYGWYTALQDPPTYSRADLYTPWMIRAYRAVKLADPTSMMSTTGIDDGGDGHAAYFINLIYNYGGGGYFDAVADHPYAYGGNFQSWKLDQIRSALDAQGDTHVKVWITEFGYNWADFTDEMTYYFNQLVRDEYDYVRIATWHTANEFPWEAGFGLLDKYLNPKPEYNTFKNYPKPSRPVISNISVTNLTPTCSRVNYTTDVPARGLVMYGRDLNYSMITARESVATTAHEALLVGLTPGETHYYRIRAGAVEDGDSFSLNRSFTAMSGTAVQVTSGPTVSEVTEHGATVTWTTDVPSTSVVHYGQDFSYGGSASAPGESTSHSVRLSGLAPGANYQYRIVSAAAGFGDASVEGYPFTTLSTPGLLENPGFENGATGWTFWEVYPWRDGYAYNGHTTPYINGGAYIPTPATMEGTKRVTLDVGWASAVGGLYQTIGVYNGTYLVAGWVAAGCDGGAESIQLIARDGPYSGGIPAGVNIADISASTPWRYYFGTVDVTTGQLTIALRVSQWDAVDIVAGHFDGISVSPVVPCTIGQMKAQTPGTPVFTATDKVVSAVIDANTFYMQEEDRSSGIRVTTTEPHGAAVGQRVRLRGSLVASASEAFIADAVVLSLSSGQAPRALAMECGAVGGRGSGLQPAVGSAIGPGNTGLFIRTWGRVAAADSTGFDIENRRGASLRCWLAGADTAVQPGDYVGASGISSAAASGSEISALLLVSSVADVQVYPEP